MIQRNTFYHSWKNVPRVFGSGSISNSLQLNLKSGFQVDLGTGKDSYRPVSNFTYFFDYFLFGDRPFGSHLINIIIHAVNATLVYSIVDLILLSPALAFFAALVFSVHPIHSEAVAIVSYRADILAAMFALFSFYFWLKFSQDGRLRYYGVSLVMYFLAVFSKENVFILPLVFLCFEHSKEKNKYFIGFLGIFLFFIYLYLVVFPPPLASSPFNWLGGSFFNHCLIMGYVWFENLINVVLPWTVKAIPGLYRPPVPGPWTVLEITLALAAFIAAFFFIRPKESQCAFWLLWYIILYLPVSDLIRMSNPMASRYMYLPSVGLLIVYVFFLRKFSRQLSLLVCSGLVLICFTRTLFLNEDWKSNFNVAWAFMRDYPLDGQGYSLMGRQYLAAGVPQKALPYLEKGILLGAHMPSDALALSACYIELKKFAQAKALLKQILERDPDYEEAQILLKKCP